MTNKIVGVGGYDGKSSGEVASNVSGSKLKLLACLLVIINLNFS